MKITKSVLHAKASAELEEQIKKELAEAEDKSLASILENTKDEERESPRGGQDRGQPDKTAG